MTQQETLDYNKRCAEFLHWEINDIPISLGGGKGWFSDKVYQCELGLEMFDDDWNWIMEVVEAIQKIVIKNDNEFCIEFYEGLPNQPETFVSVGEIEVRKVNSKEAVIEAINQFLIWYEQNNTRTI